MHRVQVQNGKPNLRRALPGYNAAARRSAWLVLVDRDQDHACAAALATDWLPVPSQHMRLRVVVRQIEAWLLADAERFASFFAVKRHAIPTNPDSVLDAKEKRVGPAYTSRLIDFASNPTDGWRLDVAMNYSRSLGK